MVREQRVAQNEPVLVKIEPEVAVDLGGYRRHVCHVVELIECDETDDVLTGGEVRYSATARDEGKLVGAIAAGPSHDHR